VRLWRISDTQLALLTGHISRQRREGGVVLGARFAG
jgi:hypothetical protein